MRRELDHLAALLHMAVEHKRAIGFEGSLYIEPKPKEPTKHQYDFDAASVHGFLVRNNLVDHYKLNIEANHATLAGHTFQHELAYAVAHNLLGSVDANRGDELLGWDTDQFPTDVRETTLAMLEILRGGGFTTGGLNFDAKLRRQSIDPVDLFHAHIGAMDAFALGLKKAARIIEQGWLDEFVKARYAGWDSELGSRIERHVATLEEMEQHVLEHGEPELASGRQEMLENRLNDVLFGE
jgi:xylose isomerase